MPIAAISESHLWFPNSANGDKWREARVRTQSRNVGCDRTIKEIHFFL